MPSFPWDCSEPRSRCPQEYLSLVSIRGIPNLPFTPAGLCMAAARASAVGPGFSVLVGHDGEVVESLISTCNIVPRFLVDSTIDQRRMAERALAQVRGYEGTPVIIVPVFHISLLHFAPGGLLRDGEYFRLQSQIKEQEPIQHLKMY